MGSTAYGLPLVLSCGWLATALGNAAIQAIKRRDLSACLIVLLAAFLNRPAMQGGLTKGGNAEHFKHTTDPGPAMQSVLEANDLTELMQMVRLHILWFTGASASNLSYAALRPGVMGKLEAPHRRLQPSSCL